MKLGIDRIDEYLNVFQGKRIGLITNPTGLNSRFQSTIDILYEKADLRAMFAPEHGVRGDIQDGVLIKNYIDEATGVMVYSLYSDLKKPDPDMMEQLDMIAIDIQDAGSRFYTFPSTMAFCMMACAEYHKEFVVFDRPNPIGGRVYEGNILDVRFRSFVGYYPIVQRHGMTIGELAKMFNKEFGIGCQLTVIPMAGWNRDMYYEDTGLLWVMPSPNLPTPQTAVLYNGTCIFEGTNVSEGRGTTAPFQIVGAPYVNPGEYAAKLNGFHFPGVYFRPLYFTPTFSKYKDQMCGGVEVHVLNRDTFSAVKVGWAMLDTIRHLYPEHFRVNAPWVAGKPTMLEYNTGCDYIIKDQYPLSEQFAILERDTAAFGILRKKYLLY